MPKFCRNYHKDYPTVFTIDDETTGDPGPLEFVFREDAEDVSRLCRMLAPELSKNFVVVERESRYGKA